MSEIEIKKLPVTIDSTSKAYITYNPNKFDIIPVDHDSNSELIKSELDVLCKAEVLPVQKFNEKILGLKSEEITEAAERSEHNKVKSWPVESLQKTQVKNPYAFKLPKSNKSKIGVFNIFGSTVKTENKLNNFATETTLPNKLGHSNYESKYVESTSSSTPNDCNSDADSSFEALRKALRLESTKQLNSSYFPFENGKKSSLNKTNDFKNHLAAMQRIFNKCEEKSHANNKIDNFTMAFKDGFLNHKRKNQLQPVLNNKESEKESNAETIDMINIKAEPMSPKSQDIDTIEMEDQSSSMSVENMLTGTYRNIRSGLSDGEYSSNSGDNFEMVYVKSELHEGSFYPEASASVKLKLSEKRREVRRNETPEQRAQRLLQVRDAARFRRQQETEEQRSERLRKDREKKRKYRAKMKEDDTYEDMLAKNRIIMRIRRQDESYREKERERDRIRHQIKRANSEFRHQEKVRERERKRLSRFLKKYAEIPEFTTLQDFAHQMFNPPHLNRSQQIESNESNMPFQPENIDETVLQN